MKYTPDKKSIRQHEIPEWFHDAKLGIFIHWGLYSVPAFASVGLKYPASMNLVRSRESFRLETRGRKINNLNA